MFELREYQKKIVESILNGNIKNNNTLVILPTGLGKTLIAIKTIEEKIKSDADSKAIFLAPTKPLVKQHFEYFKEVIKDVNANYITGEISKEKREKIYDESKVIFSTPQTLLNDIEKGIFKYKDKVSVVIFDEAHRAVGNYSYTKLANYFKDNSLIVGLTASPGSKREKIENLLNTLFIKNIEIRTAEDSDVSQYIKNLRIKFLETTLPQEHQEIKQELEKAIRENLDKLQKNGFSLSVLSKRKLSEIRNQILEKIKSGAKYTLLIIYFKLMHLVHMLELIETQGANALKSYIEKLEERKTKSGLTLIKSQFIKKIKEILLRVNIDHPKLNLLLELIKKLENKKIIVFVQYKDQIKIIEDLLIKNNISAKRFIGKKEGYTRKMQEQTISEFRENKFRVLIASSIGEEGLDIPSVDVVIFYEPIPSEIRSIQRKGRAGRFKEGEVYILYTKNTRDERYLWTSYYKEKKMKKIVLKLKEILSKTIENKLKKEKKSTEEKKDQLKTPQQLKISDFFNQ